MPPSNLSGRARSPAGLAAANVQLRGSRLRLRLVLGVRAWRAEGHAPPVAADPDHGNLGEEQADRNMFSALRYMAAAGPLGRLLLPREGWMRIVSEGESDPDSDRIDVVTAKAESKLGNPISAAFQDETGLYTKRNKLRKVAEVQRRGAAGMEWPNARNDERMGPGRGIGRTDDVRGGQGHRHLPVLPEPEPRPEPSRQGRQAPVLPDQGEPSQDPRLRLRRQRPRQSRLDRGRG